MTNNFSTKKALIASIVVLSLCFSTLVGTTFAWFTDSVTSANNIIKSGNLDVELEYWDGDSWEDIAGKSDILTNKLWEPGVTEVAYLRVANAGSLALKYQLGINIVSETAGKNAAGEYFSLSDYIQFGVVENVNGETGAYADRGAAVADVSAAKKISEGYTKADSLVAESAPVYLALVVWMPEETSNVANHDGVTEPKIELGINVVATQMTAEEDSFDELYDEDATYPNVSELVDVPSEDVDEPMPISAKGMKVDLPAEVVNDLSDDVKGIQLVFADPVVKNNALHFDYVDLVDQNGVKIDLSGNTVEIPITLPVQTNFAPGTTVEIYHDGEKMAVATVAADGSIPYAPIHLCEVEVTAPKNAYYVGTADDFYNEVYYGGMVIPTADITLTNYLLTFSEADVYLNGKSLTAQNNFLFVAPADGAKLSVNGVGNITTGSGYAGYAEKSGVLTVNGGSFNLGSTNNKGHFYSQNSGKIVINDGTFISSDANTPIVYCINGFVEINGGFFQNTANPKQALLSMGNNLSYINNQKITISGGTFVNWNPMDSAFAQSWTNPDVPALIVLAEGCQMISETQENGDIWYTVVSSES